MNNNGNMIIHILANIFQKQTRDNSHRPKCNTHIINIRIRLRVRQLACKHNVIPNRHIPINLRQLQDLVKQTGAREFDCLGNSRDIKDVVFDKCDSDAFTQFGHEFVVEDVVVGCVADYAADDTDCEGEGGDSGDEVIRTDDRGDDWGWDYDTSNPEAGDDEDAVHGLYVVDSSGGESAAAGCHHARGNEHEGTVVAAEDGEQPEDGEGACEDWEADGHAADSDADGVVTVDVEGLGWPEEEDGEEIGAGDEGDY